MGNMLYILAMNSENLINFDLLKIYRFFPPHLIWENNFAWAIYMINRFSQLDPESFKLGVLFYCRILFFNEFDPLFAINADLKLTTIF